MTSVSDPTTLVASQPGPAAAAPGARQGIAVGAETAIDIRGLSLTFQTADRTLKDKDADKQRERIVRTLEAKFGAKLRE